MKTQIQAPTSLMHSGAQSLSKCDAKLGLRVALMILAFTLVLISPSRSQAQLSSSEINDLKREFISMLMRDPIKFGPDIPKLMALQNKYKNQLKDERLFYQGMNLTVMDNRNALFNANPCLADLTVRFYLNVMEKHLARPNEFLSEKYGKLAGGKPNLNSKTTGPGAGIGRDGWAWQEALETAGGNSDLAMIALSTWAHDDRYISLKINSAKSLTTRTIARLKNLKNLISNYYANYPSEARDQMVGLMAPVFAHDGSITLQSLPLPIELLLPGSLGIDIENSLKAEIARVQAPVKGAESLPAKYYHVYAAAASGCSLRQAGLSADVSTLVQTKVAEVYRNKRLCADVQRIQELGNLIKKDEAYLLTELDRILQNTSACAGDDEKLWKDSACILAKSYFGNLPPLLGSESGDGASKQSRIAKILDRIYAADILAAAALSTKHNLDDCNENSQLIRQVVVTANTHGEKLCGKLDPDACLRGLNTIATWKIDFDWTVAQQSIGARFGANQCQPADENQIKAKCGY